MPACLLMQLVFSTRGRPRTNPERVCVESRIGYLESVGPLARVEITAAFDA